MWDCKYRTIKDWCRRRRTKCFPGGVGCVLKGFEFPLRIEEDPLLMKLEIRKCRKRKYEAKRKNSDGEFD